MFIYTCDLIIQMPSFYASVLSIYTHGKLLGNTSRITRLNFGLTFSNILKVYQLNFLNNQHLYYLKLLQSENDEYQTITVSGSDHFGYRNLISGFRTILINIETNSFHEV